MTDSAQYADRIWPEHFAGGTRYRDEPRPSTPPTMLGGSELQMLSWMAENLVQGVGKVVDLGTWLGGSTVCLASGLRKNTCLSAPRLYSYDRFLWYEVYAERYNLPINLKDRESFLPIYKDNIAPWKDVVEIRAGDVAEIGWDDGPIELLFIDLMKSQSVARYVVTEFFPNLIPNRSYIIQQDYKHYYTYWIHLLMFRLRQYFDPALNVCDAPSTVFKLRASIPADALEHACDFESFDADEIDAAFHFSLSLTRGSVPAQRKEIPLAHAEAIQKLLPAR